MAVKDKVWRRIRLYMIASEVAKYADMEDAPPRALLTQLRDAVDAYR